MNKKEVRFFEFENQSQEEMGVSGYAATFDKPTILYVVDGLEFREVIDKDAFKETDMKDCCFKYNHNDAVMILSRTRGGSLKLKTDDFGLFFDSKLFDTQSGRDVHTLVKAGVLDRCSFAFTIAEGGARYDKQTRTRIITKIEKLWDVSIVDTPAYDTTSVSARSFFDAEAEREIREQAEAAQRENAVREILELTKGEK